MDANHKTRWVLSPVHDGVPDVHEYCTLIFAPYIHEDQALCRCTFNAQQFAAAVKDPRFVICPSLHARAKVHPEIAAHHAEHGIHGDMLLHEALEKLGELHHAFLPDF